MERTERERMSGPISEWGHEGVFSFFYFFAKLSILRQHKNDLRNVTITHLELNLLCTQ